MSEALSVITPLFQSAATIRYCMESVITCATQVELPVEHILIFDGADPAALDLVEQCPRSRWVTRRVLTKKHSGIASSRNAGVAEANSLAITFLDADDEMTIERLLLIGSGPLSEAVIGRQEVVDPLMLGLPGQHESLESGQDHHYLTSITLPTSWMREIGGFDETFHLGDDWDLILRLRKQNFPIRFVDEVFTRRHVSARNASRDTQLLAHEFIRGIRGHLGR